MTTKKQIKVILQIAQEATIKPIKEIAEQLDILEAELEPYGHYKAKLFFVRYGTLHTKQDGKVILVTAINPTPAGEGKSTVTVGLAQALHRLGKKRLSPCVNLLLVR